MRFVALSLSLSLCACFYFSLSLYNIYIYMYLSLAIHLSLYYCSVFVLFTINLHFHLCPCLCLSVFLSFSLSVSLCASAFLFASACAIFCLRFSSCLWESKRFCTLSVWQVLKLARLHHHWCKVALSAYYKVLAALSMSSCHLKVGVTTNIDQQIMFLGMAMVSKTGPARAVSHYRIWHSGMLVPKICSPTVFP